MHLGSIHSTVRLPLVWVYERLHAHEATIPTGFTRMVRGIFPGSMCMGSSPRKPPTVGKYRTRYIRIGIPFPGKNDFLMGGICFVPMNGPSPKPFHRMPSCMDSSARWGEVNSILVPKRHPVWRLSPYPTTRSG